MHTPLRICSALLCLTFTSTFALASNEKCPVLVNEDASDDHTTVFRGETIRFCCSECVKEFEANPELYISVVPQLQSQSWFNRLQAFLDSNTRTALGSILLLVLGALMYFRLRGNAADATPVSGVLTKNVSPVIPLAILCGVLCWEVANLRGKIFSNDLADGIHFATFYDFGFPPVPQRPALTETRLASDYYRGNDERSPKLFNEGNYRTAKFSISICDADGNTVDHGDPIAGRELFLKFDIERPPFTPDFLYLPRVMDEMFLTGQCDTFLGRYEPIIDRVGLTTVEGMQAWSAKFPLGKISCCKKEMRGIVYVCEAQYYQPHWWSSQMDMGGARIHYGIRYELATDDGKLAPESDMWMGALYRTRKFAKWKVPMNQWFSHEPIPELPGKNVNDPKLLCIDEHQAYRVNGVKIDAGN